MFPKDYRITNKQYLEQIQKGQKVNKNLDREQNNHTNNSKPKKEKSVKDEKKENDNTLNPDKGKNIDFYA